MQSERLKYMKIEQGHSPLLFLLYTNEEVRQYLGGALGVDMAKQRVENIVAAPPKNHWVMQNEHSEPVGLISLDIYYDGASTEVSYCLSPRYWRRGYAEEAIVYIARWAKVNLKLKALLAETQLANLASVNLLKKLRFEPMGQVVRFGEEQAIYQLNLLDL